MVAGSLIADGASRRYTIARGDIGEMFLGRSGNQTENERDPQTASRHDGGP